MHCRSTNRAHYRHLNLSGVKRRHGQALGNLEGAGGLRELGFGGGDGGLMVSRTKQQVSAATNTHRLPSPIGSLSFSGSCQTCPDNRPSLSVSRFHFVVAAARTVGIWACPVVSHVSQELTSVSPDEKKHDFTEVYFIALIPFYMNATSWMSSLLFEISAQRVLFSLKYMVYWQEEIKLQSFQSLDKSRCTSVKVVIHVCCEGGVVLEELKSSQETFFQKLHKNVNNVFHTWRWCLFNPSPLSGILKFGTVRWLMLFWSAV